ncbi:MAG: hypothetical protein HC836_30915 [Richelia sp. RM2_1_2]|nr:hypothetical protein [Richelia sp. RM1_1_1]NJO62479.1 hypothetical protein [Richelia sp. RM2_1_2]
MSSSNYDDCNRGNCPFKTDPFDEYREVCVKCGKTYSFRRNNYWLFMILWAILGLLLFSNKPESRPEFQQEPEPVPTSLSSRS